ncbi:MAG: glycosyltransferase, partial [Blastocatellia bacterium]
ADYLFDAKHFRGIIDICVTDGRLLAAAAVQICGIVPERVVSIPGGVRSPIVPVTPRTCKSHLRIGYVGRLAQSDKRVLDLIPLVARLEEGRLPYTLVIAGDGPEREALLKSFARRVEEGKVSFAGWVDAAKLSEDIYPHLDCLVQFSPSEGVTIAGREAMVHGVVPVTSQFTGLNAEGVYLNEVNSLVFPVGDISAAAEALRRLSKEPGLLSTLSANAMDSQTAEYTYEGAINSWAMALDRCLKMPLALADARDLNLPPDGRLARLRVPDGLAQRIRDLARRRSKNNDPSGEWPTNSGVMDAVTASEIKRFAADYEAGGFSPPRSERNAVGNRA